MSAAVRWRRRGRAVELVTAQARIAVLTRQLHASRNDTATALAELSGALAELAEARRELARVLGHRAKLARAVRNRSSLELPADLLALIEEEGLAE